MYKAIGWDIGIKNLAYCVLETKETNETNENTFIFNKHTYDICNWKDISLVTQIESNLADSGQVSHINNTLTCCGIKNSPKQKAKNSIDEIMEPSEKICGKKAFYAKDEVLENGDYEGLCKTHFKKLKIARLPILSVKKCWTEGCSSKPVQVLKSHIFKGFCKKHINEMHKAKTHTDADFFKINRAKTTAKIDINQLGIALFQELNKIKESITEPSIILLENQPVLKNPTMKSMQMFLYSYYLIRTMETNNGTMGNKKLQCYCASKKLDLIKFLPEVEQTRIMTIIDAVNNPYQKNKKMSIHIVEYLLKDNKKLLDFFNGNAKKDDLADSLLMTLHYFEKANLIKIRKDDKKEEKDLVKKEEKKEGNKVKDKKITKVNVKVSRKKKKKNGSKELEILEVIQEE